MSKADIIFGDSRIAGPDVAERSRRAASGFRSLGADPGSRIAILLRNDPAFLEASLAAQLVGAYPVPINWHFHADEIMHVIADCDPVILVVHADLLAGLTGRLPASLTVIAVPPPPALAEAYSIAAATASRPGHLLWPQWLANHELISGDPPPAPESLIYTSGTTGKPKGVKRQPVTPEIAAASDRMRAQVFGISKGARVLIPSPIYHTAPNFFALRALKLADVLVLSPRFDPEQLLVDIEHHAITHLYAVPTLFVRLLELPEAIKAAYDLRSLRFVLHAGGPCSSSIKERMIEWLGPVVFEYYGSTEHGPLTFCSSDEWLAHPGTVGKPALGVTLRIEDDEGQALPTGTVGEIIARNAAHPDFTYHNLPAEREALRSGDLIRTGDVGYLDADGFLYLCDRKRDVVISGGVNIYPAEIEAVLAACPGVRDVAVFGVPEDAFGEALVAVVQPVAPGTLDRAAVRAFLADRLARFKVPRHIEFDDALPREDSGKIRKRLVRDAYLAGRQASGPVSAD